MKPWTDEHGLTWRKLPRGRSALYSRAGKLLATADRQSRTFWNRMYDAQYKTLKDPSTPPEN